MRWTQRSVRWEKRGHVGAVVEGIDTEGLDTVKGCERELIVLSRQPLQTGLLKISNLAIQRQISCERWKE